MGLNPSSFQMVYQRIWELRVSELIECLPPRSKYKNKVTGMTSTGRQIKRAKNTPKTTSSIELFSKYIRGKNVFNVFY